MKILTAIVISIMFLSVGCSDDETAATSTSMTVKGADNAATAAGFFQPKVTSPTSLKIKIYNVWLSTNGDCSDPVQVLSETNPSYSEMTDNPTIGSGALADGTYNCIIIAMSDQIVFTPSATDGNCAAGTEYTIDVCSTASGGSFTDKDGNAGTCDDTDQSLRIYISTFATATDGGDGSDPFAAPTAANDSTKGFNLSSAMVKSGAKTGTFIADFTNKVDGSGAGCDVMPPTWNFN